MLSPVVQTEKELADDLATQMAMQAQQLVAERADMAARNAELARENAQASRLDNLLPSTAFLFICLLPLCVPSTCIALLAHAMIPSPSIS